MVGLPHTYCCGKSDLTFDEGVVDPSPACARALETTIRALEQDGHDCIEIEPPSPYTGLKLASQLLTSEQPCPFSFCAIS